LHGGYPNVLLHQDASKKDRPPSEPAPVARQCLHRPEHLRQTQLRLQKDPPKLHGTYYRWTGIIAGKRTTKTISQQEAAECQKRIRHYRALQKKVGQLVKQSLKKAPWNERPLKHQ
jgi:hypothetical protein